MYTHTWNYVFALASLFYLYIYAFAPLYIPTLMYCCVKIRVCTHLFVVVYVYMSCVCANITYTVVVKHLVGSNLLQLSV